MRSHLLCQSKPTLDIHKHTIPKTEYSTVSCYRHATLQRRQRETIHSYLFLHQIIHISELISIAHTTRQHKYVKENIQIIPIPIINSNLCAFFPGFNDFFFLLHILNSKSSSKYSLSAQYCKMFECVVGLADVMGLSIGK